METINEMIANGEYLEATAKVLGSLTGSIVTLIIKAAIFWMVGRWVIGF